MELNTCTMKGAPVLDVEENRDHDYSVGFRIFKPFAENITTLLLSFLFTTLTGIVN
jgi:hypothetical protein